MNEFELIKFGGAGNSVATYSDQVGPVRVSRP